MMRKTFKYRLYPTKSQRTKLKKTLDGCRWVYNKVLEIRSVAWKENKKSISKYETMKKLPLWKAEQPELTWVFSQTLQEVCTRVDLAFRAFFRRVKTGEAPGYPRFKSYERYDSFTYTQKGYKLEGNRLKLFKIGLVKIKLHRPIDGQIKTLTIRRDRIGNWYACFSCIVEPKVLPPSDKVVGIDLGLTTFAYFSNGNKIERQRWMKQDEKELAKVQRRVSKAKKGSKERAKAKRAVNHVYQRIVNRRKDFAHQEARKLVDKYQVIVFEKLDIVGMQDNKNKFIKKTINKGIADVAWERFVQSTIAKAGEAGRTVVQVDPKNTTQLCSDCGKIVKKELKDRTHNCPYCGLKISRDLNAAINILTRGLASLDPRVIENPM